MSRIQHYRFEISDIPGGENGFRGEAAATLGEFLYEAASGRSTYQLPFEIQLKNINAEWLTDAQKLTLLNDTERAELAAHGTIPIRKLRKAALGLLLTAIDPRLPQALRAHLQLVKILAQNFDMTRGVPGILSLAVLTEPLMHGISRPTLRLGNANIGDANIIKRQTNPAEDLFTDQHSEAYTITDMDHDSAFPEFLVFDLNIKVKNGVLQTPVIVDFALPQDHYVGALQQALERYHPTKLSSPTDVSSLDALYERTAELAAFRRLDSEDASVSESAKPYLKAHNFPSPAVYVKQEINSRLGGFDPSFTAKKYVEIIVKFYDLYKGTSQEQSLLASVDPSMLIAVYKAIVEKAGAKITGPIIDGANLNKEDALRIMVEQVISSNLSKVNPESYVRLMAALYINNTNQDMRDNILRQVPADKRNAVISAILDFANTSQSPSDKILISSHILRARLGEYFERRGISPYFARKGITNADLAIEFDGLRGQKAQRNVAAAFQALIILNVLESINADPNATDVDKKDAYNYAMTQIEKLVSRAAKEGYRPAYVPVPGLNTQSSRLVRLLGFSIPHLWREKDAFQWMEGDANISPEQKYAVKMKPVYESAFLNGREISLLVAAVGPDVAAVGLAETAPASIVQKQKAANPWYKKLLNLIRQNPLAFTFIVFFVLTAAASGVLIPIALGALAIPTLPVIGGVLSSLATTGIIGAVTLSIVSAAGLALAALVGIVNPYVGTTVAVKKQKLAEEESQKASRDAGLGAVVVGPARPGFIASDPVVPAAPVVVRRALRVDPVAAIAPAGPVVAGGAESVQAVAVDMSLVAVPAHAHAVLLTPPAAASVVIKVDPHRKLSSGSAGSVPEPSPGSAARPVNPTPGEILKGGVAASSQLQHPKQLWRVVRSAGSTSDLDLPGDEVSGDEAEEPVAKKPNALLVDAVSSAPGGPSGHHGR